MPPDPLDSLRTWLSDRGLDPSEADSLLGSLPASLSGSLPPSIPARRAPPTATPPPAEAAPPDRYERLAPLGSGGMGEVWRVRDLDLNRTVALKVLRPERALSDAQVARFVEEAQVTAQLQHPAIVPVHEVGQLDDGRLFFTMKEVAGRTLGAVLRELHAASAGAWGQTNDGWTLRRLVAALRRACEAAAYAHARGVTHRDLKPSNVMVGAFGEVYVMDWGLARVFDRALDAAAEPVQTDRADATRAGAVAGTPAYMPPEQARGERERLGPPADVYALGGILFAILSGAPPVAGATSDEALANAALGNRRPLEGPAPIPPELAAICDRALRDEPADRYPDAGALGEALQGWLDGARRRAQALEIVAEAEAGWPEIAEARERAEGLRVEAEQILDGVKPHEPSEKKEPAWAKQDEASQIERDATLREVRWLQSLRSALRLVPDLPEANDLLAEHYKRRLVAAEARRDRDEAARFEALVRAHDTGRHARWLRGDGAVTLVTDPPGAAVKLFRYAERKRRLVPEFVREIGPTPIVEAPLARGSWLLIVEAPGRAPVRYPVFVDRLEHWHGVAPGETAPHPIYLPRAEELAEDDCYVPAGWFWSGGDPDAPDSLPLRRLWVDGFAIKRFPVTNGEYIAFLNDLLAQGREEEALRYAPREQDDAERRHTKIVYGRSASGFVLREDASGQPWRGADPVIAVDWFSADAYAAWAGGSEGSWRLLHDHEREKAARGVDRRLYPAGDSLDPAWACLLPSHASTPLWADIHSYPLDESPYGVRGLAGNVRDWCSNGYQRTGPAGPRIHAREAPGEAPRMIRGGAWQGSDRLARSAGRFAGPPAYRLTTISLRVARDLGPLRR